MWFVIWIALSVAVGWFWQQKGLSMASGVIWSLLLSPVVGFVIGLVKQPDHASMEARELDSGDKRKCPFCAELIKREAIVCRFCGKDLPPVAAREPSKMSRACSACGEPFGPGDRYCPSCGNGGVVETRTAG